MKFSVNTFVLHEEKIYSQLFIVCVRQCECVIILLPSPPSIIACKVPSSHISTFSHVQMTFFRMTYGPIPLPRL